MTTDEQLTIVEFIVGPQTTLNDLARKIIHNI